MKTVSNRKADPILARMVRDARRDSIRFRKQLEKNEPIPITRVYPDGRREKLVVPGHEILTRGQSDLQPLSKEKVRELRIKLGMTQQQLANWLMVSIATVRYWEQKSGIPRGPALRALQLVNQAV